MKLPNPLLFVTLCISAAGACVAVEDDPAPLEQVVEPSGIDGLVLRRADAEGIEGSFGHDGVVLGFQVHPRGDDVVLRVDHDGATVLDYPMGDEPFVAEGSEVLHPAMAALGQQWSQPSLQEDPDVAELARALRTLTVLEPAREDGDFRASGCPYETVCSETFNCNAAACITINQCYACCNEIKPKTGTAALICAGMCELSWLCNCSDPAECPNNERQ